MENFQIFQISNVNFHWIWENLTVPKIQKNTIASLSDFTEMQ